MVIDWLEPDLRQTEWETLNCAAGNYFVLEEGEEEEEGETEAGRGGGVREGLVWVHSDTWWSHPELSLPLKIKSIFSIYILPCLHLFATMLFPI